ncbi:MAG: mechanosensitive ion channel family protein [Helicobacteraceae bacterium]|jgi:MscS family membrane protein|nr:mechanosensitive ion channel family protein [Helicobacteraceae bacterium]
MNTDTTTEINTSITTNTISEVTDVTKMTHALHDSVAGMILDKLPISDNVIQVVKLNFVGNALGTWFSALIIFVIFLLLRKHLTTLITLMALKWVSRTKTQLDDEILDILQRPIAFGMIILGFNVAFSFLTFSESFSTMISNTLSTLTTALFAWVLYQIVKLFQSSDELIATRFKTGNGITLAKLLLTILKVIILIIAGMDILSIWGVNITGFVASLGLIGMAFALAAKDTASNFFGSMVIFTDQPFKVDDWIKTPEVEGIIEHIGIRSTKVRTFARALVSVPNGNLADTAILNWSEINKRRIKMTLGLTYSTTSAQMRQILEDIRTLLNSDEEIHQETIYVHFTEFQDSALGIFCYFFTKTTNWGEYMQVRERINLELMSIVEKNGASFAFPSQSLYVESMPENTML